jgi:hypothetical protein
MGHKFQHKQSGIIDQSKQREYSYQIKIIIFLSNGSIYNLDFLYKISPNPYSLKDIYFQERWTQLLEIKKYL